MNSACLVCSSEDHKNIGNTGSFSIVQCNDCGLRFLDPVPTEECLSEFYASQENFSYYASVIERKLKSGRRKIQRLQKYCSRGKFLDIGCSTGANVEAARRLGYDSSGIDLCEAAINFARNNFPNNQFSVNNIAQVQKESKHYDLVFCTEVIEHIPTPHEFVESLRNIMNINGILYMTTPDAGHFRVPRKFSSWKHVHAPDHLVYFNHEVLKQLLTEHHIQVLRFEWTTKTTIQLIARRVA